MKIIATEREIKEYFEGLRKLLWGGGKSTAPQNDDSCQEEEPAFRKVLIRYLNQSIEAGTDAGILAGVLQEVGTDYALIMEPSGTRVVIRFTQINYVQGL